MPSCYADWKLRVSLRHSYVSVTPVKEQIQCKTHTIVGCILYFCHFVTCCICFFNLSPDISSLATVQTLKLKCKWLKFWCEHLKTNLESHLSRSTTILILSIYSWCSHAYKNCSSLQKGQALWRSFRVDLGSICRLILFD